MPQLLAGAAAVMPPAAAAGDILARPSVQMPLVCVPRMERKVDRADTHGYLIWWQAKALFGGMEAFVEL